MDLVRTRRYVQKFYAMRTQLQAVSLRIQVGWSSSARLQPGLTTCSARQTLRSNQAMADALKGVTKAMQSKNSQMNLPAIQKIMMDFEKESGMMDMKEEMMNDVLDDVMDEEGEDEEESEQIVQQVFDEIGINLDQQVRDRACEVVVGVVSLEQLGPHAVLGAYLSCFEFLF